VVQVLPRPDVTVGGVIGAAAHFFMVDLVDQEAHGFLGLGLEC
jgi:hypothetical protein